MGRSSTTGGYRRYALTEEDHLLREWFGGAATARALALTEDRMGNQWAWWGDPDERPGVVTGSHLDSVPDGGAFDGPLGVVSAFAASRPAARTGIQPDRPIGVVHFGDEKVPASASRAPDRGRSPSVLPADRAWPGRPGGHHHGRGVEVCRPTRRNRDDETLRRVHSFIELHVEQGRRLMDLGRPVAIGTHIWLHGRWRLDFGGEANHAGTTAHGRPPRRDDPAGRSRAGRLAEPRWPKAVWRRSAGLPYDRVASTPSPVRRQPGSTPAAPTKKRYAGPFAAVTAVADVADGTAKKSPGPATSMPN